MDSLSATFQDDLALQRLMRPILPYLQDERVREIAIPSPGLVFLRQNGRWNLVRHEELTLEYLEALVSTMASYNKVDFEPIMSLKLPGGERAQIAQGAAVLPGSISVNLRKHSNVVKSLEDLAREGALLSWRDAALELKSGELSADDRELLALLKARDIETFLDRAVQQRRNILIAGKTGSGKTTFARSLIERVSTDERLITMEDVHELFLPNHLNCVHLMFGVLEGQVSIRECLAACMRSSPDRIFLSEIRGAEAWEYMQALNTGHPGSISTLHANSATDAFSRAALMVKQSVAGSQMDLDTIMHYLRATIDITLYYADYKLAEVYFDPERRLH